MTAPTATDPTTTGTTPGPITVAGSDHDGLRAFRRAAWARDLPGADAGTLDQLVDRDTGDDRVLALHRLAVVIDDRVVAAATLRRDGATAWLDALETDPAHRGRGYGRALLARSRELAAEHGCDLLALGADPADRPRDWYRRSGFTPVGLHVEASAPRR
nr:GNAT family N-acetyltransferase [Pseudonocardia sp. ICBG1293]